MKCKHSIEDLQELGSLVYYENGAPEHISSSTPYAEYLKINNPKITVLLCLNCGEIILRHDPWKKILGEKRNE